MGFSKAIRYAVHRKYNGHCSYCGEEITIKEMQVDHIFPKHKGGSNDILNLNPSCKQCNHYKGTFSVEEFRGNLKTLHERLEKVYIYRLAKKHGIVEQKEFSGKFYFEKFNKLK